MPRIPLPITFDGTIVRRFRFRACDGTHVDLWANNEVQAVATFQDSHEYEARGWWKGMFFMNEVATVDCGEAK